jgi:hypothetical protein
VAPGVGGGSHITHREDFLGPATGGSWMSRALMTGPLAPFTARIGRGLIRTGLEKLARMAKEGAAR